MKAGSAGETTRLSLCVSRSVLTVREVPFMELLRIRRNLRSRAIGKPDSHVNESKRDANSMSR